MVKTICDVVNGIEITPYLKENVKDKLEMIESKGLSPLEELRHLLNFICPNMKRLIPEPDISKYNSSNKTIAMYFDAYNEYSHQNSHYLFPYTIENLELLKKYIKENV